MSARDVYQVEGGFVGLYAILMTRGPSQYKVPALCDVPSELTVHQLADAENPRAIYLSKVPQTSHRPRDSWPDPKNKCIMTLKENSLTIYHSRLF